MFSRYGRRLNTTFFLVFALLFSQLALANYVCASQLQEAAPAALSVMNMAPGMPCEGMGPASDQGHTALCHQHCSNAPQSVDPINLPTVSLPAVVQVFVIPFLLDVAANASASDADIGQGRSPPAPLFLSTLRLRV